MADPNRQRAVQPADGHRPPRRRSAGVLCRAAARRRGTAAAAGSSGHESARAAHCASLARARACALPAPAHAGTYDVYACGGPAGGAQNAFVRVRRREHGRLLDLPPGQLRRDRHRHEGDLERRRGAVPRRGVPGLHGAAGRDRCRASPSTSARSGCTTTGRRASSPSTATSIRRAALRLLRVPARLRHRHAHVLPSRPPCLCTTARRFRFETRCGSPGGCPTTASGFTPGNRALFSAANVSVRVDDWTAPAVDAALGCAVADRLAPRPRGGLDGLHRQRRDHGHAHDRGRRRSATSRTTATGAGRPGCAATSPARGHASTSCRAGSGWTPLRSPTARTRCGWRRWTPPATSAASTHDIHVDNHAPAKPDALALEGGEGWRAVNDFTVRWSNPAGQASPIARARYRLCDGIELHRGQPRGRGPRVAARSRSRPRASTRCVSGWRMPPATTTPSARAIRSACASTTRRRPPSSRLPTPSDPLSVVASVADRGAGVVAGSIEARRAGEAVWRDLGARLGRRIAW